MKKINKSSVAAEPLRLKTRRVLGLTQELSKCYRAIRYIEEKVIGDGMKRNTPQDQIHIDQMSPFELAIKAKQPPVKIIR
jgi:hypothetical protein